MLQPCVRIAVCLWVGSLWTAGYLVAPLLFHVLDDDRALAGQIAGRMFVLVGWVGLTCAAIVLVSLLVRRGGACLRARVFWLAASMCLLALAIQFGIAPIMAQLKADALPRQVMESALRDRFATWHGISSGAYLLQSLLGLCLAGLWQGTDRNG